MATKKQIAENSLSMEDIIKELNSYKTPYKVDWQNLADSYLGNKAWPEKTPQSGDDDKEWWEKEKTVNEKILSDDIEPIQGQDDKPLTKDEVESLI